MFNRRLHYSLLVLILLYTATVRLYLLNVPFHSTAEGVGSWYGIMARNYLRIPWHEHLGVPVQSIGHWPSTPLRFYSHHPPLMPLTIALSYKIFGQGDWQTRLPPALATLGSTLLLYLLLKNHSPPAALYAAAIFASLPIVLYYGGQPEFLNPQFVFLLLLATAAFFHFQKQPTFKSLIFLCLSFTLAAATDWPAFYLVPLATIHFLIQHKRQHWPLILTFLLFSIAIFAALYTQIVLVSTHDWTWMLDQFRTRTLGATPSQRISLLAWLRQAWTYNHEHHTIPVLILSFLWLVFTLSRCAGLRRAQSSRRGQGEGFSSRRETPNRETKIDSAPTIFLLSFAVIHLLIGRQGSYSHSWWWWPLTPFLALSSALAIPEIIHRFPARTKIPAHILAILLLCLFAFVNLKKTLPELTDPAFTSANEPYDGPTLAAAVRFASPDPNTPVILVSADSHPSLWYYADRPIKFNIWSVAQFQQSLTEDTADLPFYFQQTCPARPTAIIVPKLYANAAKDLLEYLRAHYPPLQPPPDLANQYEFFTLHN
jgi:hypothetical protein